MADSADFFLLDVRTAQEFAQMRIAGAVLIPQGELRARAGELPADRGALILVYCRTGARSAAAARELAAMGFTNVHDFGGIHGWPYGVARD
jgi:rhodanese-related sulfurtransferase